MTGTFIARPRRLWQRLSLLAAVGGTVACVTLAFLPVARINPQSCEQIQPGMTLEQATEIIGGPPGWYDGVWGIAASDPDEGKGDAGPSWVGDHGKIIIKLDTDGRVAVANFYPGRVLDRSIPRLFFERVTRNAFGLEWASRADCAWEGVWQTTAVVLPAVVVLLLCRRGKLADICFVLLIVGVGVSTIAMIFVIDDIQHGEDLPWFYRRASGSVTAMALFLAASIVAFFRHAKKRIAGP